MVSAGGAPPGARKREVTDVGGLPAPWTIGFDLERRGKNMRLTILALILSAAPIAAEPVFDAEAAAKKLAPFIDRHTFIVGRLDARAFDMAAFAALVEPLRPGNDTDKKALRLTAKAWQDAFLKKGGREICIVYSASDYPQPPCLLTPIGESPAERKDLYELLRMVYENEETDWANLHGFLCVGTKAAVKRLRERKPTHRDDVVAALAGAGDGVGQIVFAPSADARRIFEELAPTLPSEIGGGSIQTVTRGLKWASLAVGSAPKFEARLIVQAADEASAEKLRAAALKGLDSIKDEFKSVDSQERDGFMRFYRKAVELVTPRVEKDRLVVTRALGTEIPELAQLLAKIQPAARAMSSNNLKQLGLACHNFASTYGDRLPTDIRDKNGKALLSWRVAILPYIEQLELYQKFKLDEPWDSDHNKPLIEKMPKIFMAPKQNSELKTRTTYLAPLGKGLMWDDPKGVRFQDITDGTSNTILLVEGNDDSAVIWTKPEDLAIDMKNPTKGLMGHYGDGFLALMGDGSVRFIAKDYTGIWAAFTRAGGEVLPDK
jgi:hypothetical protein